MIKTDITDKKIFESLKSNIQDDKLKPLLRGIRCCVMIEPDIND